MKFNTAHICIFSLLILTGVTITTVTAATTATVTATVTAQNISVTVSDGAVSYGTLSLSGTANTASAGLDDSQDAANDGNVAEDFNIQGQDTASWTLEAAAGADQYQHDWCTSDCDGTPTWNALTTSYQQLANAVSAGGTQNFDLRLSVPTSTADYTQQSVNVTVQAVAD